MHAGLEGALAAVEGVVDDQPMSGTRNELEAGTTDAVLGDLVGHRVTRGHDVHRAIEW